MIDSIMIMEAIKALAAQKLPELQRICIDRTPKEFKRPSLLIQLASSSVQSATATTQQRQEYFTLTIYSEADSYDHTKTRELLGLQSRVLGLFAPGYLRVGDRALGVSASTGGREWDRAFVDVQLEFFEVRTDQPDAMPLMEELHTNMTTTEKG